MRQRLGSDRGAAAVEFAIVVLPLLLLLLGIMEFGRAYRWDLTLSAAARAGARVMALNNSPAAARTATENAAQSLSPGLTDAQIAISPATCTAGATVTLTVTYPLRSMTGLFKPILNGKNIVVSGVMQCNG